jgi:hypothetical protein
MKCLFIVLVNLPSDASHVDSSSVLSLVFSLGLHLFETPSNNQLREETYFGFIISTLGAVPRNRHHFKINLRQSISIYVLHTYARYLSSLHSTRIPFRLPPLIYLFTFRWIYLSRYIDIFLHPFGHLYSHFSRSPARSSSPSLHHDTCTQPQAHRTK